MVLAYIKLYLAYWIRSLSVLELNQLRKEIDAILMDRCDQLLEEEMIQVYTASWEEDRPLLNMRSQTRTCDNSKVFFREMTHPSEM